jgi:transcriptional regulator with XRE-family HTH domain
MVNSLQTFLIAARTRRGLSQQELANVAQCHIRTIGEVERGVKFTWTPRVASMIGRALHEVERMTVEEISDFLRLTNVSGAIFNTPPESETERERKVVMPVVDRLISQHGMIAVLNLLHSIEQFTNPRAQPQEEPAEEEPPIVKHVTPPRYRQDLGGTEQIITQYQAAKPPAKKATPLKRKGTR